MKWMVWTAVRNKWQEINKLTTKGITMRTYEQALQHYINCKKPTRSKKWLAMPDSPRYLRNVSSDHMGIHMTSEGAIYYRLYRTNVAVFYPPEFDGTRKVVMNYYNSQTTNIFMYENNLHYHHLTTTDGKQVRVPYVSTWDRSTQQHTPSATLYFNREDKLIVHRSEHKDIYTYKSSAEDKQKRKDFKKKLDVLMTLAMFRLPEYRENVSIEGALGEPFGTAWRNLPREIDRFRDVVRAFSADDTENPRYIEAFLEMGQAVFNILASHKVYQVEEKSQYSNTMFKGQLFRLWGLSNEEQQEKIRRQHEVAGEVTAEEFKKSMTNRLLEIAGIKSGTVKTPWGQFRETIPHKYFT